MTTRAEIVAKAREAVGTPFHHRGRQMGMGLDCAGLLIVVGRELGIFPLDFDVPEYTGNPDGTMLGLCDRYMTRITRAQMRAGDAVALITDNEPQHLGIVCDYRYGGLAIIHASNDRAHKRVIEMRLMFSARFRFAGAWSFPGVE
jgi:cell wall-associated NlpC family hydrolase